MKWSHQWLGVPHKIRGSIYAAHHSHFLSPSMFHYFTFEKKKRRTLVQSPRSCVTSVMRTDTVAPAVTFAAPYCMEGGVYHVICVSIYIYLFLHMYTNSENCASGKKTSQMLHIMRCNLYGCLLGNHILETWITAAALSRAHPCQIIDALFSIDSARRTQAKSCDLLVCHR